MQKETVDRLRELTEEKKRLFAEYLRITDMLADASQEETERISEMVGRRGTLAGQIDLAEEEMRTLCRLSGDGEAYAAILQCRADYSALGEKEAALFDACQQVFALIARIREKESLVYKNFEHILGQLQASIRRTNTNARFAGYLKQMNYEAPKGVLYDNRK